MNEQIKQLAVKSGAGEWGDSVVPAMMDIEKFAQSIVNECAMIAEECDVTGYGDFRSGIAQEIKRYFGV